ncbi:MAG: hypothetical protein A2Y91_04770 [Chloroflexi bacterium RBG_13_54_8]|nr:MAG: hypothetical protein A2Y91_04770 [Chloroflexi bacterium RBG_13_54_8]
MRKRLSNNHESCLDAAFRYLSYRPRSQQEIRTHLKRKGFDAASVEHALLHLNRQGLLNDLAFAQFWKENRESFSPRSRAMLQSELRAKGIAVDTIAAVVEEVDEESGAWQAAAKKTRTLVDADYDTFRRKLNNFLRQRGFSYEVIQRTVDHLWQERGKND